MTWLTLELGGSDRQLLQQMNAIEMDLVRLGVGSRKADVAYESPVVQLGIRHNAHTGYRQPKIKKTIGVLDRDAGGRGYTGEGDEDEDLEIKHLRKEHRKKLLLLQFEKERLATETEVQRLRQELTATTTGNVTNGRDDRTNQRGPQTQVDKPRVDVRPLLEDIDQLPVPSYAAETGLVLAFDFVSGFPDNGKQCQIAYAVFDRNRSKSDVRVLKPARIAVDNASAINWAHFASMRDLKVAPVPSLKVVLEVRVQTNVDSGEYRPVGWTVFSLFKVDNLLDNGRWYAPSHLYQLCSS